MRTFKLINLSGFTDSMDGEILFSRKEDHELPNWVVFL